MNLHEDKEMFGEYLAATADYMDLRDVGIDELITFEHNMYWKGMNNNEEMERC